MDESPERWFGVGRSLLGDPAEAGAAAAREALRDRRASLLVVFASLPYATQAMAEAVHGAAGGAVPMIGCSTAGEFGPDGRGESVVVLAFGGPGFQTSVRAVPAGSCDLREAGMRAAACLDDITSEHRTVLLLGDGRSSDQQEMVRGAYAVAGAGVPLVGACAADGLTQTSTRHFFSDGAGVQVLTNGVLAAALGSAAPLGIGLAHGWRKTGEPMVVTRSHQGKIFELDGERALDVYLRRSGAAADLPSDPGAFFAFATVHPLGLSRRTGEDLRVIFAADVADGSISGLADTPEGAMAWYMEVDPEAVTGAAAAAAAQAVDALDGADPLGVFVFDCCVRGLALGPDGADAAGRQLAEALAGVPFGGFYSNGEIVRTTGAKGMHHLTVAALAVG
ncbi:FIST N-terminal domain-containing protein [Amorphoplanes nipponensis]|uniref:Histidine kinase n=1 Tax=Actinoplanes nipponensis TaxID=135950 RepID=A0A919JDX6_9ACTN|nr:FIST N-terminal domain-containing protein [Actinoplanes nipponensis]GIE48656.1 histidine kinase [Actinoplanes nipponensis]